MRLKRLSAILQVFLAFAVLIQISNARIQPSPIPNVPTVPPSTVTLSYCPNQYSINAIAPWYCSQIDQAAYKTFAEWEPILLLAVLFSFMIAALIFIIGVAARNKKIVNYGIGEFYEAGASLIFVVFFMLIAALIFGILPGLYIGVDPYNTSLTYIYNTINATQELLKALYNPAMVAYFYTSININVETLATATTIINYLAPALEVLFIVPATALSTLLVEGLMVLYAEFYLIMFAMYASIPILLIPGVFLRSILPTRGVGGLLIGAAIGFYFILPTLFSIAFFFTSKGTMQAFVAATAQLNSIAQGSDAITNGAVPNGPNSIPQEINVIKSAMGSFWISVIFYPALILALTYFSITTIADLLGGMAMSTGALARV
ncbi:MAG: hypothetical protein ACP5HF_00100 [Candidatus Micrarchaeia archaeon]